MALWIGSRILNASYGPAQHSASPQPHFRTRFVSTSVGYHQPQHRVCWRSPQPCSRWNLPPSQVRYKSNPIPELTQVTSRSEFIHWRTLAISPAQVVLIAEGTCVSLQEHTMGCFDVLS